MVKITQINLFYLFLIVVGFGIGLFLGNKSDNNDHKIYFPLIGAFTGIILSAILWNVVGKDSVSY